MDSTVAIDNICKQLRANQKGFHTAGTKDKRAVTAQFVTTYVKPKALLGLNKFLKNVKIGNIEVHQERLVKYSLGFKLDILYMLNIYIIYT